ncbi:MAG TPA: cell division control protein Cdc6, partial [Methanomicrobiales archaeon]|nr:cell division control protein Cdc6 [Methanomicrobiales archaeon]
VLYSMLLLEYIGKKIFTSGEVLQVYREVAGTLDVDVLTNRRITDLVSELSMLGVINTRVVSKGRYGRTKEMWFDMTSDRIWEVLSKDQRLSRDTLIQLDTNRLKASFR